ncbi:MAG: thioredoxin domain-containing protein [Candidatus Gracilibacteria bacterium]
MSLHAKRNSLVLIVMTLCTITIILTNYIFSQNIVTDINNILIENEYKKIGGKENYMILQEVQKREIMRYIEKIRTEQPELVKEILNKEKSGTTDNTIKKVLNKDIINDLRKNTSILGNTGSLISIIEFSDMECEFCIKQHSKGIKDQILENYSKQVNYIFKNFPLPAHKNARIEAEAAKCIERIAGSEKYIEFVDNVFSNTDGGGEGFNLEKLTVLAKELSINEDDFNTCITNSKTKEVVEREFSQGRMLGIEAVPANLIINNETGEYIIITEEVDYEDIEKIILDLLK